MTDHYEFTETAHPDYTHAFQIRALVDLPQHGVYKGDLGGYAVCKENLTEKAWVGEEAVLCDREVRVSGVARVTGQAVLVGDAVVKDQARVKGDTYLSSGTEVSGYSIVTGAVNLSQTKVTGGSFVKGSTGVLDLYGCTVDGAEIVGNGYSTWSTIRGDGGVYRGEMALTSADLRSVRDMLRVGPIGSESHEAILYRTKDGHTLKIGCWKGQVDQLAAKVQARAAWSWNAPVETMEYWQEQYKLLEKQCRLTLKSWELKEE